MPDMTIDSGYNIVDDDFIIQIRISCLGSADAAKHVTEAAKRLIASIFNIRIISNNEGEMRIFGSSCSRCVKVYKLFEQTVAKNGTP